MGFLDSLRRQLRSVIEWENPGPSELFTQWTDNGDEIKNASKLIIGPGQGCVFVYEGKVVDVLTQEGTVDLKTANIPFWTTITKVMQAFESEHKVSSESAISPTAAAAQEAIHQLFVTSKRDGANFLRSTIPALTGMCISFGILKKSVPL